VAGNGENDARRDMARASVEDDPPSGAPWSGSHKMEKRRSQLGNKSRDRAFHPLPAPIVRPGG
jgi:hypothetical protein